MEQESVLFSAVTAAGRFGGLSALGCSHQSLLQALPPQARLQVWEMATVGQQQIPATSRTAWRDLTAACLVKRAQFNY